MLTAMRWGSTGKARINHFEVPSAPPGDVQITSLAALELLRADTNVDYEQRASGGEIRHVKPNGLPNAASCVIHASFSGYSSRRDVTCSCDTQTQVPRNFKWALIIAAILAPCVIVAVIVGAVFGSANARKSRAVRIIFI